MNKKTPSFFVTGGAGFIGSHLSDKLIKMGRVTVYDNLSSGKKSFISHLLNKPNFRLIEGDLLDFAKLKKTIKYHETVFHLAANPDISYGVKHPDWDLKQETIATHNVLEAMRQNNIKKIVFSSSSAVIGQAKIFPTGENYGPLLPYSLYGANKLACEGLISAYTETFGFQAWVFRFANIVGGRATHGVLLDFITQLKQHPKEVTMLSDGSPRKSYLLVDECVDAIVFAFKKAKEKINLFNLAALGQTSVNEIAGIIIEEMKLKDVIIKRGDKKQGWAGDVTEMMLDNKKICELGWESKYNSTESVRQAVRRILCQ